MSRKNISLSDPIETRADDLIKLRGFSGLSDLIAALIREEHERHHPPTTLRDAPNPTATISNDPLENSQRQVAATPVSYAQGRRRGARKSNALLKKVAGENPKPAV